MAFSMVGCWILGRAGAQPTTAMDFQGTDCNNLPHHLFADLDAGNAVILEFFMNNCVPCIDAGHALEAMKTRLLAEFPGKVKGYAFGFNNSYSCTVINNWVNGNGFTSVPMDSGAAQVSYYGGFGMPTVVLLGGGSNHSVLGTPYIGFSESDTATATAYLLGFLNTATSVHGAHLAGFSVNLHPHPLNGQLTLEINALEEGTLSVELIDISGRQLGILFEGRVPAGMSEELLSMEPVPRGCYLLRVHSGGRASTYKIATVH
ncbi:MAG: hypothetical protein RLZZ165_1798 [Bacteroidota bacterium]